MAFFVEGKPFDPQHALHNAVSNIICSIVFGDRFDYDNKRFAYLLEILKENIIQSGSLIGQVWTCKYMFAYNYSSIQLDQEVDHVHISIPTDCWHIELNSTRFYQ